MENEQAVLKRLVDNTEAQLLAIEEELLKKYQPVDLNRALGVLAIRRTSLEKAIADGNTENTYAELYAIQRKILEKYAELDSSYKLLLEGSDPVHPVKKKTVELESAGFDNNWDDWDSGYVPESSLSSSKSEPKEEPRPILGDLDLNNLFTSRAEPPVITPLPKEPEDKPIPTQNNKEFNIPNPDEGNMLISDDDIISKLGQFANLGQQAEAEAPEIPAFLPPPLPEPVFPVDVDESIGSASMQIDSEEIMQALGVPKASTPPPPPPPFFEQKSTANENVLPSLEDFGKLFTSAKEPDPPFIPAPAPNLTEEEIKWLESEQPQQATTEPQYEDLAPAPQPLTSYQSLQEIIAESQSKDLASTPALAPDPQSLTSYQSLQEIIDMQNTQESYSESYYQDEDQEEYYLEEEPEDDFEARYANIPEAEDTDSVHQSSLDDYYNQEEDNIPIFESTEIAKIEVFSEIVRFDLKILDSQMQDILCSMANVQLNPNAGFEPNFVTVVFPDYTVELYINLPNIANIQIPLSEGQVQELTTKIDSHLKEHDYENGIEDIMDEMKAKAMENLSVAKPKSKGDEDRGL